MDDFKLKSILHKQDPWRDVPLPKKYGRRAARRTSKLVVGWEDLGDSEEDQFEDFLRVSTQSLVEALYGTSSP